MKTYVITFSREFPSTHKRSGEETGFVEKILSGNKIHTIRDSYYFWEDRFKKIYKGDACLSLRYWSGEPYKSKQVEFLKLTKDDGIGMQPIVIDDNKDFLFVKPLSPNEKIMKGHFSNINKPDPYLLNEIAKNDGLDVDDFEDWFKGKQMIGAIIHFTDFRY